MSFTEQFLREVQQVVAQLDVNAIENAVDELALVRERGGRSAPNPLAVRAAVFQALGHPFDRVETCLGSDDAGNSTHARQSNAPPCAPGPRTL